MLKCQMEQLAEKLYFSETMKMEDGDVVGYAIPPKFGGTSTATFNRFPACQSCTKEWDDILTSLIVDVTSHKFIALKFEYESENQTRPLYFYYTVLKFYDFEKRIKSLSQTHYGLITNNADKNLNRVQPYVQFQDKRKVFNINLTHIQAGFSYNYENVVMSIINNVSASNFNGGTGNRDTSFMSCHKINFSSDQESHRKINQSSAAKATIEEMLKNPMVRLFDGENLTGNFEDYHSGMSQFES
ncbi:unnamed protein product, partial [Allacma fusca]